MLLRRHRDNREGRKTTSENTAPAQAEDAPKPKRQRRKPAEDKAADES